MENCETQADLFKALAHPTRLFLLEMLGREDTCVCHLVAVTGKRQANISQHLAVLRNAGLVRDYRRGLMVYYGLVDRSLPESIASLTQTVLGPGQVAQIAIPDGPVPGCPCPRCTGQTS